MAIIFGDKEAVKKRKEDEAFAKFGGAIKAAIMDTEISPYHMARIMFEVGDWYTSEYETITDWQEMIAGFRGE